MNILSSKEIDWQSCHNKDGANQMKLQNWFPKSHYHVSKKQQGKYNVLKIFFWVIWAKYSNKQQFYWILVK